MKKQVVDGLCHFAALGIVFFEICPSRTIILLFLNWLPSDKIYLNYSTRLHSAQHLTTKRRDQAYFAPLRVRPLGAAPCPRGIDTTSLTPMFTLKTLTGSRTFRYCEISRSAKRILISVVKFCRPAGALHQ